VLTGSGLRQQNASTKHCCNPIRSDAVERVTRIELVWPAWKVAVAARTRVILDGGMSSGDTVNDHI